MSAGSCFGVSAALQHGPRRHSVTCVTDCEMYTVEGKTLRVIARYLCLESSLFLFLNHYSSPRVSTSPEMTLISECWCARYVFCYGYPCALRLVVFLFFSGKQPCPLLHLTNFCARVTMMRGILTACASSVCPRLPALGCKTLL